MSLRQAPTRGSSNSQNKSGLNVEVLTVKTCLSQAPQKTRSFSMNVLLHFSALNRSPARTLTGNSNRNDGGVAVIPAPAAFYSREKVFFFLSLSLKTLKAIRLSSLTFHSGIFEYECDKKGEREARVRVPPSHPHRHER